MVNESCDSNFGVNVDGLYDHEAKSGSNDNSHYSQQF